MKPTIGQNIAFYRKKAGMTQEELSEKIGVTAQAVSKWENDLSYPDLEVVRQLAGIFGITVDQLLNGEDAVPAVQVVETEHPEKRIVQICVESGGMSKVHVRIPVGLVEKLYKEGKLKELMGEDGDFPEGVIDLIQMGAVGPIVDIKDENSNSTVRIEVINYEG